MDLVDMSRMTVDMITRKAMISRGVGSLEGSSKGLVRVVEGVVVVDMSKMITAMDRSMAMTSSRGAGSLRGCLGVLVRAMQIVVMAAAEVVKVDRGDIAMRRSVGASSSKEIGRLGGGGLMIISLRWCRYFVARVRYEKDVVVHCL